ncbi:putative quinol monooxygenase [Chelativorans sp. YIM 93263]|uniref:putative quinol monooxygenase n=1 Tax=Chelativorans sp. YIM 93263 TaxID=2906648 RepID=UPI002377D426|nr:antibiotic biosynthesis monooxygenase family protein [Chelativorans sp. YIM 93263]
MEENAMIMIAGHLKVPAAQRSAFVNAHADLVDRARAYSGCLDLSISEDPFDPSRVNLMELWESETVLQEWRKVANPPKMDVQIEDGNVQKHHISRSGPPF